MKNIIHTIAFLLFTLLSFGQKSNNDIYKMNQENINNFKTTGCISQYNYEKDVELRVKSKKITNDEIEVIFEYVEIPRGCYRGDLKSSHNRNGNYNYNENVYDKGFYRTRSADNHYVTPSTYNASTYSTTANMGQRVTQYY
jgi:hypothetical protein